MALLLFQRALMLQQNLASAGKPRLQQNQSAVGIDGECFGFFLDGPSLGIRAANADGAASPPDARENW